MKIVRVHGCAKSEFKVPLAPSHYIMHGPFRNLLDEVVGDLFAEVEGFGETQDFKTQDTRREGLGSVDVGLKAIHLEGRMTEVRSEKWMFGGVRLVVISTIIPVR